jgi:hypothetical protein
MDEHISPTMMGSHGPKGMKPVGHGQKLIKL